MGEMVERVARAILEGHDWTTDVPSGEGLAEVGFDALSDDWKMAYCAMARAAIAAMREPTDAMYLSLGDQAGSQAEDHWHTMIDAALAEP